MKLKALTLTAAGLAAFALTARADFFDRLIDSAQDSAERAVQRNVDEKVDRGVDKAMNPDLSSSPKKAKKAPARQAAPADAEAEADAEADEAPAEEAPPPPKAKGKAKAAEAEPADKPLEVYGNKYDFVPGDKVLVFDDFSDSDVGEYPARWSAKEGGGDPIEVVEVKGGKRFMKLSPSGETSAEGGKATPGSITWLRYAIKGDMPTKFTVEFDADMGGPVGVLFNERNGFGGKEVYLQEGKGHSLNMEGKLPVKKGVQHVAIAVSGSQVKLYVGGERVLSDPDGIERPITRLGVYFLSTYEEGDRQMLTNFRLAEGGKDARTMLATGRIVTHAITFDTGSDVLKPESGPMLRTIRDLLNAEGGLKFRIEGHTDDQGSDKVNLPLSEKRAQAVRAWLIKEGIDGARLQAKGFGSQKPIDTAGTPEARANNRRVEFVKL